MRLQETRDVDWDSNRITENTRASYPIEHMGGWVGGVAGWQGGREGGQAWDAGTRQLLAPICALSRLDPPRRHPSCL